MHTDSTPYFTLRFFSLAASREQRFAPVQAK
jgi:hypothetical protein